MSQHPHPLSPTHMISIDSAIFAQLTRLLKTQTDTQTTLRATSVATGRNYALHAGDADLYNNNI